MLNGEVFGNPFYAARNPSWTYKKPMMGLRSNGQLKGKEGRKGQKYVRKAFALTAIKHAYGQKGFVMMNGRLTPKSAFAVQKNIRSEMNAIGHIAVGEQAQQAKMEKHRVAAHASSMMRWEQGNTSDYMPNGDLSPENEEWIY